MRRFGAFLKILGLVLGILVGCGILLGIPLPGLPWLVTVGLVKLSLVAALGLIGGGAALQRIARRSEERARLGQPPQG